jgi:hypothetical protein
MEGLLPPLATYDTSNRMYGSPDGLNLYKFVPRITMVQSSTSCTLFGRFAWLKWEIWKFDTQLDNLASFDTQFDDSSKIDTLSTNSFKKRDSPHILLFPLMQPLFAHVEGPKYPWLQWRVRSLWRRKKRLKKQMLASTPVRLFLSLCCPPDLIPNLENLLFAFCWHPKLAKADSGQASWLDWVPGAVWPGAL